MPRKAPTNTSDRIARFRVIRQLASLGEETKYDERMKLIADIASGKVPPEIPREPADHTLAKRLADGQASRSPRANRQPTVQERKESAGRNRMEGPALNRTTDFLDADDDPVEIEEEEESK